MKQKHLLCHLISSNRISSTTQTPFAKLSIMPNDTIFVHKMLILLGLMTIGISLIVASFQMVLSNKTHNMLLETMVQDLKTNQRAFRAAKCDLASCTGVKTLWKTRRMTAPPASTVRETKVVYVSAHDRALRPTIKLGISESLKLVPHAMPTKDVEGAEKRNPIVDVNKPEMQM